MMSATDCCNGTMSLRLGPRDDTAPATDARAINWCGGVTVPLELQCRLAGLPEPVTELRFAPPRRWRADYAWPDQRVMLECDGGGWVNGRHSRGPGIERDAEKQNAAAALGYRVLRCTPAMIADGRALEAVRHVLTKRAETCEPPRVATSQGDGTP